MSEDNERLIVFDRLISKPSIEQLLEELKRANAPQQVLIDSPGGTFEFFSSFAPALSRRGITTLAGDVRSAAVILYLLGHSRRAFETSTFFFHEVRTLVGPYGEITIADLEEVEEYKERMFLEDRERFEKWLAEMRSAQAWFLHFLREVTGVPTGTYLNLMRGEAVLTARDAIRYGIVHQIVPLEWS